MKKIFGENCEDYCDYSQNWTINFDYFDNITKGGFEGEKKYVPNSEYIGKLYSITLRPKLNISFKKNVFSSKFNWGLGGSAGHDGKGGGTNTSFETYSDKYGLRYVIFDEITLTTYKNLPKLQKGDLLSIEYEIPDELEKKMFVEQK